MHTNWDKAPGGVSDTAANRLGLRGVEAIDDYLRIGDLPEPMDAKALCAKAREAFGGEIRSRIPPNVGAVRRVAIAPGAGGGAYLAAHRAGAQAFLTGEMHHHESVDCYALGRASLECGHYETEQPSMQTLAESLQKRLDGIQCNVLIYADAGFAGDETAGLME